MGRAQGSTRAASGFDQVFGGRRGTPPAATPRPVRDERPADIGEATELISAATSHLIEQAKKRKLRQRGNDGKPPAKVGDDIAKPVTN